MCFVKDIELDAVPKKAAVRIAADSKYWLWINGEMVIFEGGVKRGPSRNGTYSDTVNIAPHLKDGRNRIAALVWYFGDDGFSHLSSKMGGLFFEIGIDGLNSDDTWKAKRHPAYVQAPEVDEPSNFRLAEGNVYFDAAKDMGEWYATDYDISDRGNADYGGLLHQGRNTGIRISRLDERRNDTVHNPRRSYRA